MPAKFNNSLLLLARQYKGRTQGEVAADCGFNQGHYSRIENGMLPGGPSEENVEKLSASLGFPVGFFYQPDNVAGLPLSVHPMNRAKASLKETALRQIHAELNIRLIHLRRLLQALDLESEMPLPWIDVDEGGGPAGVARMVRRAWGISDGPVANLTEVCERAGVLVIWCDFDAPLDGVTMRVRDLPPCIFLKRRVPADRMRATLAHELGHIVMHQIPTDDIEDEANAFAAEFLVPRAELKRQVIGNRVTVEFLARLKAYWGVSMQFLLYRIGALGLINRHQKEYLWKKFSMNGWRKREPEETDIPPESPELFRSVIQIHADDLGYSMDEIAGLLLIGVRDVRALYGENISPKRSQLYVVR